MNYGEPGSEHPFYVENLQTHRIHDRTRQSTDGLLRDPVMVEEIWVDYDQIPFPPDATLTTDNSSAGVVSLRQSRLLKPLSGSRNKWEIADLGPSLKFVITSVAGIAYQISGDAAPTLAGFPASGYTPVIKDAKGSTHLMNAVVWVVDYIKHLVVFPHGVPSNMVSPFEITFFEYTGAYGGVPNEVTLASAGGTTLVTDGAGPGLEVKGLTAGAGIAINVNDGDLEIENTDPTSGVTLASAGGTTLITDGAGPGLEVKGLTAGAGIAINVNDGDLEIENTDPTSGVTLASAGGATLVTDGAGPGLEVKGLTAGAGIAININAGDLEIENTDPTSGVTLASAGGDESLVSNAVGPAMSTKGLTAGLGISLTTTPTFIEIGLLSPSSIGPWVFYDRKPPGSVGGAYTTRTWQTRNINSVEHSPDSAVMLTGANSIKLASPGIYYIRATSTVIGLNQCKMRVQNVTMATTALVGVIGKASKSKNLNSSIGTPLVLEGVIVAQGSDNMFEIQVYGTDDGPSRGAASNALGSPVGDGDSDEIYLVATVLKLG